MLSTPTASTLGGEITRIPKSDSSSWNSIPLAGDDATSETENELMADEWNSIPLKDRVIRADWDDLQNWRLKRGRRNNSSQDDLRALDEVTSLDDLARRWNDTPETLRPANFPLDPVVGAMVGSRVSLGDYLPTFRRYQQKVRQAVDRDKKMNGQECAQRPIREHAVPTARSMTVADWAAARGRCLPTCSNHVGEGIKDLIPQLATLDDVNHGRVSESIRLRHREQAKEQQVLATKLLQSASRRKERDGLTRTIT